jgi:hypothetical protein
VKQVLMWQLLQHCTRETELRAALEKQRDEEIELVIQRLEAEQAAVHKAAAEKVCYCSTAAAAAVLLSLM